jgi:hypothetical protein
LNNRKMSMDKKQKQRALIKFMLFEGRLGDEIIIRFHNVPGETPNLRTTVLQKINKICSGNAELQPENSSRCETDRYIQNVIRDDPFASLCTRW